MKRRISWVKALVLSPKPVLDNHHSYFVLDALSLNSHLPHFKQIGP